MATDLLAKTGRSFRCGVPWERHAADPAQLRASSGCSRSRLRRSPVRPRLPSPATSSSARRRVTVASTAGRWSRSSCGASCSAASRRKRGSPSTTCPRRWRGGTPQVQRGADVSDRRQALERFARQGIQRHQFPLPRDGRLLPRGGARLGGVPLRRRARPCHAPRLLGQPRRRRVVLRGRRARSARCRRGPRSGRSGGG